MAKGVVANLLHGAEILTSACDAASRLARRLGLGDAVADCLAQQFERGDGKGPYGMVADEVVLPARVSEVATQAVLFLDAAGPDAAIAMAERRAGGWFDPWVAATFCTAGAALMDELVAVDPWRAVLEAEPPPVARVGESDLDRVSRCFADMVDLKAPSTVGHSREVAALAEAAARALGSTEGEVVTLRRAASFRVIAAPDELPTTHAGARPSCSTNEARSATSSEKCPCPGRTSTVAVAAPVVGDDPEVLGQAREDRIPVAVCDPQDPCTSTSGVPVPAGVDVRDPNSVDLDEPLDLPSAGCCRGCHGELPSLAVGCSPQPPARGRRGHR